MQPWMIWILLLLLLFLGIPIFVSLCVSTIIFLVLNNTPLTIIPLDMSKVSDMFTMLAIPCFILGGSLMEKGGISEQIVEVSSIFVGKVRGGLALVTIVGCMFFAAMIGSGPGTVAAMGALMIPSMLREGYSKRYIAGVTATGGTLGLIIPPSNPMIIYGVMANVSVGTLFMAGFLPGFVGGIILLLTAWIIAKKEGFKVMEREYTLKDTFRIVKKNFFALMTPVIVLGGIYSGIFTAVEASAVTVFYALFVGIVINKRLKWSSFVECLKITNLTAGTSMIIVGVSVLFGRFLTLTQVPRAVTEGMLSISTNPTVIMGLIILLLFFLGMFMETLSTIVILVPILMPVVRQLGIDPVHFGIIWVVTNQVALLSPPLGPNLFISMTLANISLEETAKGAFPFILALIIFTLIILFFPSISLLLPRLVLGYGG